MTPDPRAGLLRPHHLSTLTGLASALLLAACGGGGGSTSTAVVAQAPGQPASAPASTVLSGTVAVGVAITDGKLRVIDATGTEVAKDVAVDSDGHYTLPVLSGTAPFRIEACGYAASNYQCIYSVTQGAGTANVTPLTSATVLLATGKSPDELMGGDGAGLGASAVEAAQTKLRTGLAEVMAGNVPAGFDFVSGSLAAGTRAGYDKVLDSVGVKSGVDDHAFVQITPRLGSGNLYFEKDSAPIGHLTPDTAASALSLAGLDVLFRNMTTAIASATACNSGMQALLASNANLAMGQGDPLQGPAAVAQGLCQFLGEGESGNGPAMWGSRFLSPTLGRCDFSGADPVCRVSFVIQDTEGGLQPVGGGMAVTLQGGQWKFKGDASPVSINANARAQRDRRVDGDTPVDTYARALAFDIPAMNNLQCAKIAQRNAAGELQTVAYYKRHGGAGDVRRLSVFRTADDGSSRGLDPSTGSTRSADDTWLMLPPGDEGDAVVRNFFRGGRTVAVTLYSDTACATAFNVDGHNVFEVDIDGVPPVSSALATLPWADLSDASRLSLRSIAVPASSTASFTAAWSYARGVMGVNGLTFCADRADCGDGSAGRIGSADVSASATSKVMTLHTGAHALTVPSYRMLAIYGNTGDGLGMQSNFIVCPDVAAGAECH